MEAGELDFAQYDAQSDDRIELLVSGTILAAGTVRNPIAVVANYLFDSVVADAFAMRDGRLHECLVSVHTADVDLHSMLSAVSADGTALPSQRKLDLSKLEVRFDCDRAIESSSLDQYASVPSLRELLLHYQRTLEGDSAFLVHSGGLRMLDSLLRLRAAVRPADDEDDSAQPSVPLLLLTADKGYSRPSEFECLDGPFCRGIELEFHGSVSSMVNFHAIELFFTMRGGDAFNSPSHSTDLKTSMFAANLDPVVRAMLASTYLHGLSELSPVTLFRLLKLLNLTPSRAFCHRWWLGADSSATCPSANASLADVLAVLKLSGYDGDVVHMLSSAIIRALPTASAADLSLLHLVLPRAAQLLYPMEQTFTRDALHEIGRIFYYLGDSEAART